MSSPPRKAEIKGPENLPQAAMALIALQIAFRQTLDVLATVNPDTIPSLAARAIADIKGTIASDDMSIEDDVEGTRIGLEIVEFLFAKYR